MDLLFDLEDGLGQTPRLLSVGLQKVIGDALGALGADARQAPQLVEEFLQTLVCHGATVPS